MSSLESHFSDISDTSDNEASDTTTEIVQLRNNLAAVLPALPAIHFPMQNNCVILQRNQTTYTTLEIVNALPEATTGI